MLITTSTPQIKKQTKIKQNVNCRLIASYYLLPSINPVEVNRRSYILIHLFSIEVDQSEIVRLMEVYAMLCKCTYCVFTMYGRNALLYADIHFAWLIKNGRAI